MEKLTLLDKRRKHFTDAFFDYLKKKNKSPTFIKDIFGITYQVDLDEDILKQSLISLYESNLCRKEAAMNDTQIINVYDKFYNKYGKLTDEGKGFIDTIVFLIAMHLFKADIKK
ncbi:TPA: hypothetical protein U2I61_003590 [Providencia rettgeri]|nr:hypothetical protein [Providencia rettgeri]